MKKIISIMLSLAIIFSLTANVSAIVSTNSNIKGTIFYEETNAQMSVVASYTQNNDGSLTTYQYNNGLLIEANTTVPGSGIVHHKYYNTNGTYREETEFVLIPKAAPVVTTREMGYMYYTHKYTGTRYAILVDTVDRFYKDVNFTFRQGTAKTLASWTTTLINYWAFLMNPSQIIAAAFAFLDLTGIMSAAVNGIYTVAITETIPCSYNNQKFYGNATAPSGSYPEGYLNGTYAVITSKGQQKVITEGYTVRSWGQDTFGRLMMYQVFGIDDSPDSWTNK